MAAGVTGVEVVPVLHAFFRWVPAEEDDASPALVREVEETHIQVLEDDAELAYAFYRQVEAIRLDAVLEPALPPPFPIAAARMGCMRGALSRRASRWRATSSRISRSLGSRAFASSTVKSFWKAGSTPGEPGEEG